MTRVLVVEDEESFSDALSYMLRQEGYEVRIATSGPAALQEFERDGADLVLLDLMLPGLPGTEVCRQLRSRSSVPVIMLTAKDSEIDKVVGLELGADDYVTKPYSSRELVARVRAVLRRRGEPEELIASTVAAGPVRMDVERHVVAVGGEQVNLPLKEFELLEMLLRNAGRVLTRGQLIDRVWGSDYVGDTKTLDVHIKRVRGVPGELLQPGPTVLPHDDLVALALEEPAQRVGEGRFVLHDQDAGHRSSSQMSVGPQRTDAVGSPDAPSGPPFGDSVSSTTGSSMVNVEPVPGRDHTEMAPPWLATMCLTIASPRPVPPVCRDRAESTR